MTPDSLNIASIFYLEESNLKALLAPGCFYAPHAFLCHGASLRHGKNVVSGTLCCRFHLLSDGHEGVGELLMSEILMSADKGREFYIDNDRQVRAAAASPVPSPHSSGDCSALCPVAGGFVMSYLVRGERKSSNPLVQLGIRHVTCVEDAAIFMALTAAVDHSIELCRLFGQRIRREC